MSYTYTLQASFNVAFSATLQQNGPQNITLDRLQAGSSKLTKIKQSLANGTAAGQATNSWHDQRTLAAGATDNLVLGSGSTLLNAFGVAIAFTNIRWVLIRVLTPAAGHRLVVGNAISSPWLAWFGATTHTEEVRSTLLKENQIDGWTVNAGNTLAINNPTAGPIIYDIAIIGF